MTQPIIGIDFDNTIVCYDELFYKAALEKNLIPAEIARTKESVRNHLRNAGHETAWTELQGYIFGTRMREATAYPGVKEFIRETISSGGKVFIITHKAMHPYLGPEYDLHRAARDWLEWQGFFDASEIGLSPKSVYFELSIDEKLDRIGRVHCTHFIGCAPELFHKVDFPAKVTKLLFHPLGEKATIQDHAPNYQVFKSWDDISAEILKSEKCA